MKRLQLLKSLVADLTTRFHLNQQQIQLCPLSLSFVEVCHLVTQATPSTKGVACATIHCCCQRNSDVCILLYIEERPIFVSIISA